jgi:hypothetical protein
VSRRKVSSHKFRERARLRFTQADAATGIERVPTHTEAVNTEKLHYRNYVTPPQTTFFNYGKAKLIDVKPWVKRILRVLFQDIHRTVIQGELTYQKSLYER